MNPFTQGAQVRQLRQALAAAQLELYTLTATIKRHNQQSNEEAKLLAVLRAPDRWQPADEFTGADAKDWAALLTTPLLRKLDVTMVNMAQQQAQQAIHLPSADTVRAAGYAAGFRAAWVLAKSLSTLTGTDAGKPETKPDTAELGLEHLNP